MQGDGRFLISNSKDQCIKLWDIRKFSQQSGIQSTLQQVSKQNWDYRWQNVPKKTLCTMMEQLPGDSSIMTYCGHLIKHTLLRCRFSPMFTTGQVIYQFFLQVYHFFFRDIYILHVQGEKY